MTQIMATTLGDKTCVMDGRFETAELPLAGMAEVLLFVLGTTMGQWC